MSREDYGEDAVMREFYENLPTVADIVTGANSAKESNDAN